MKTALYSGSGNTFVLADNREGLFRENPLSLMGDLDLDGVILVEKAAAGDAAMRIFNRDGSEAEMCGNGLRCMVHFLRTLGVEGPCYQISTLAGLQTGWFVGEEVCTQYAPPKDLSLNALPEVHFINTGVPHAVRFVPDVDLHPIQEQGRELRFSPRFAPAGANADFATLLPDHTLAIRTYERGVEKETLACGTGVVATALIASKVHGLPSPITLRVRSGERLKVSFDADWSVVTLQGGVKIIDEINIPKTHNGSLL